MGVLTRTQLEAEVKFRLGNRTDADSQITSAVQFAYDELATSLRIPETEESAVLTLTTASTVSTYAMPSDLIYPVTIKNITDSERLEPMSIRDYDRIRDISTTGKPVKYCWYRNELIIQPPNDTTPRTLQMRYAKRLPALSTAASVSALPREWDEVIIQGAYFRMLGWLQLPEESLREKGEYVQMIQRRLNRLAEGQFDWDRAAAPRLGGPTATTPLFGNR